MEKLLYQPYEASRHNDAIKDAVRRACKNVYADPGMVCRIHDGPWYSRQPAEHLTVQVLQKTGCCSRKPVFTLEVDRPKDREGRHEYTKASAVLLEAGAHAGNVRLLGHLQRQCPFLPKIEASMAYELAQKA